MPKPGQSSTPTPIFFLSCIFAKQAIPNGIELPPMFPRLLRPYLPATEVGGKINKISIFPFLGQNLLLNP